MLKLLAAALVVILSVMFAMSFFQDRMLFPTHQVAPPGPLPRSAEHLEVRTPDGETLRGVHIPPAGKARAGGTLILGFAGNAWNSADAAAYLHDLYPDAHAVAFHYRGYAPSTGSPSAEALIADAPLVLDAAVQRVKPDRTVAVGFSIGSGVAASLASSPGVDGLILVTPFDSLKRVAEGHYAWLPVGLLFRHEMDSASGLENAAMPVAIIAGERDYLIVPERTEALRRRVRNLVFDRTIRSAGHNDIYGRPEFRRAMHEARSAVAPDNSR